MKLKTESIMNIVKNHGKVVLKMDRSSGLFQLTITRAKTGYVVGGHPGGKIRRMTESDVYALIDDMHMFIDKWYKPLV
ncbi:hypothetical protein CSP48_004012 [Salmonella enterica subsp. arizonae]|nr:hypothetical protein [Salmonella enterica subsp. arizonae]